MIYRANDNDSRWVPSSRGALVLPDNPSRKQVVVAIASIVLGVLAILVIFGAINNALNESSSSSSESSISNQELVELAYWVEANEYGSWDYEGKESALDFGYLVCAMSNEYYASSVVEAALNDSSWQVSRKGRIAAVASAVSYLCPEHRSEFQQWSLLN